MRSNFLTGLDPRAERDSPLERRDGPLGPDAFYFQGLASTSGIYAGYQPNGVLRLKILGARSDPSFDVTLDLLPSDREEWRRRISDGLARQSGSADEG